MTDKIKLMSEEEIEEASEIILTEKSNSLWEEVESRLLGSLRSHEKLGDMWTNMSRDQFIMLISIGASWARDECEKRATERLKEVCYRFFLSALDGENFEEAFQQFLKEQDGE